MGSEYKLLFWFGVAAIAIGFTAIGINTCNTPATSWDACEYKYWMLEELKQGRALDEPVQKLVLAIRECEEGDGDG